VNDLSTVVNSFETLKEKVIFQNKSLIEQSINSALETIFQSKTSIEIVIENKPKQSNQSMTIIYSVNGD